MPRRIIATGVNAQGHEWVKYDDGSYYYLNDGSKFLNLFLKLFCP